jgi:hypothetical protein
MNEYTPHFSFVVNILYQKCQRWTKQLTGLHGKEGSLRFEKWKGKNAKGYAVPCEHERVGCNDFNFRI